MHTYLYIYNMDTNQKPCVYVHIIIHLYIVGDAEGYCFLLFFLCIRSDLILPCPGPPSFLRPGRGQRSSGGCFPAADGL